ncbi:hypothetical protein CKM354_000545300 [Cercospora kikuchii]|uniref:CST complex subunit Ten1 n=1 Tax=Cercospora kikuchii TaxID=84275 RepID=A0A9P3CM29_9PEZI|nr:uncharacterized protein CKM354_000545300 [Cercospora kikuchii]GIZ42175.1 hypothetical protein CKM354_000545300 [Cercospora kikuchii]
MSEHDPANRRPEPARLILLDQAQLQAPGTKIRLLGCVHAYHIESATLVLKVDYPGTKSKTPTLLATIDNVLENVHHDLLQVGSWLNIVGYVQKPVKFESSIRNSNSQRSRRRTRRVTPLVDVLMIWSAGAVKLDDYLSAVRSFQETLPARP